MTRKEAVAMAKQLADKGMSQTAIAQKLADAGYLSGRTNKPIAQSSVGYMLKTKRRKARKAPPPVHAQTMKKARSGIGKSDAIKSILKLKGMAAEERIALALLVLE